jgi:hypothetical protein
MGEIFEEDRFLQGNYDRGVACLVWKRITTLSSDIFKTHKLVECYRLSV